MAVQNDPKPRKRRKGLKIALGILLVLSVALISVGFWQKNNLEAVMQYAKYSQEELEQQLQDNDQQVQDILQAALDTAKQVDAEAETITQDVPADTEAETVEQPDSDAPDMTPAAPSKPEDEAAPPATEPPKAVQTPQSTTPAVKPETNLPQTTKPAEDKVTEQPAKPVQTGPTYEQQLQGIVDKAYALRAEYLQALDDLQAEAVAAYKAIPAEKRTAKAIASFVNTYINKATTLEKTCDGKMDALASELTQLQKKYGQSMELVDTMKYTYANEKSLKKAWYMSELEKRGFI